MIWRILGIVGCTIVVAGLCVLWTLLCDFAGDCFAGPRQGKGE